MFISINPYSFQELFRKDFESDNQLQQKLNYSISGFKTWRDKSFKEKSQVLLSVAKDLRNKSYDWAQLISNEMGKTMVEAKAEIEKCAAACEYYAAESENLILDYQNQLSKGDYKIKVECKGAVLGIMPWNYPFWQVFRYVLPNLMVGNVCLLKHAPNVGMCANAIEELFANHTPVGVFQVLWADLPQLELVVSNSIVIGTTLTGSEKAGSSLAELSGKYLKKTVLELGGSDPFIVDKDCKLEYAVEMAIKGRLQNNGQTCIAAKRFIINEAVFESFKTELLQQLKAIKSGNPFDSQNQNGTLARIDVTKKLKSQINNAISQGAKVIKPLVFDGNVMQSVVIEYEQSCDICINEEFFGPVFLLTKFKTTDEALEIANNTPFGLAASIWSNSSDFCKIILNKIEAGNVFVNELPKSDVSAPFGGTKKSGFGRELSVLGLTEFANIKTIKFFI